MLRELVQGQPRQVWITAFAMLVTGAASAKFGPKRTVLAGLALIGLLAIRTKSADPHRAPREDALVGEEL